MLGVSKPRSGRRAAFLALVATLVVGIWASSAPAEPLVVPFDPTGGAGANPANVLQVAVFDEAPGSALAQGAVPLIDAASTAVTNDPNHREVTTGPFSVLYEAPMSVLNNANGIGIYSPGQGTNPAITVIASFRETATVSWNPGANGGAGAVLNTVTFSTSTPQTGSFFAMYSGSTPNLSTGAGFNNGTLIYYGTIVPGSGTSNFTNEGDQGAHLSDINQTTQGTVTGVGATNNLLVQGTYQNPNYFLTNVLAPLVQNYNGTQNLPFGATPAATKFYTTTPPPGLGNRDAGLYSGPGTGERSPPRARL